MHKLVWLAMLIGCAHHAAATAPCAERDVVLPAEEATFERWKEIMNNESRSKGAAGRELLPELVGYLGSPNPVLRDKIGYSALNQLIRKAGLPDDDVRALVPQLVGNLRGPLEPGDGVFRRSFSALVLASVVERDNAQPFLRADERRAILSAARDYARRETTCAAIPVRAVGPTPPRTPGIYSSSSDRIPRSPTRIARSFSTRSPGSWCGRTA